MQVIGQQNPGINEERMLAADSADGLAQGNTDIRIA